MARSEHHGEFWRAKLVLHYDGRNFFGWQTQRNRRTVQGELSSLLARLCGDPPPKLMAAGRTDRGVHATGQVASALIPARFGAAELLRALNSIAPHDIWIESIQRVADDFHPRYDAISRTYVYRVGVTDGTRSPFVALWCWPLARPLNRERLDEAAGFIIGEHDFDFFAKSGQPERGTRCQVRVARWRESAWRDGVLEFEITADRYLHHMVRYLVEVMVDIGRGTRQLDELGRLIRGEAGLRAPAPAPPQGLFLTGVEYTKQTQSTGMEAQGGADEDIR